MLEILDDKHRCLRTKCEEVKMPLSEEDRNLILEMVEHLKLSQDDEYASAHNIKPGVGLAAPQIGVLKRMFAIYLNDGKAIRQFALVNPKILRTSVKRCYLGGGEGCLSVPQDHKGLVHRYYKVVIQAFDALTNEDVTLTAYGYLAIALQHEYDHLDGILYYDHIDKKNPFKVEPGAVEI